MERNREMAGDQLRAQKKQNQMSAAGTGAAMGVMAGGPAGALVGGAGGFLVRSPFSLGITGMSNTGLSSLNVMDGLMKGGSFVNGFQQQKRANDIEDKKLTMAEATHNQQTKLNDLSIQGKESEALLKDFDRDTRLLAESG